MKGYAENILSIFHMDKAPTAIPAKSQILLQGVTIEDRSLVGKPYSIIKSDQARHFHCCKHCILSQYMHCPRTAHKWEDDQVFHGML